ncbi:MAG: SusC/RagA family TonB-linked outer membrane protein [Bacteroidales bacterium]|nr:SusC/RagA family TonB-linked outer membrane protein [Bacteroidales bacterium]
MKKLTLMISLFVLTGLSVLFAQTMVVNGTVTSSVEGEGSIPGVSVVVKGTTIGTTTEADGSYTISVPNESAILIFQFIGMKMVEEAVNGRTTINVVMEPDLLDIDEVVVTALGISRERKALGYAVQEIEGDDLAKSGNTNFANALQGKVAGLDITPSSGMPGASSSIVIRGARSFSGNNQPLYVVDGQPIVGGGGGGGTTGGSDATGRILDLNPADIESINVLKGQAASALYGIRASNGVIVITTKSGAGNKKGAPVVSFSTVNTFDEVSRTPDYQSTYSQGSGGVYSPRSSQSWGARIEDLPDDPVYGGNDNGYPGKFYVPQLADAGYAEEDQWVTPTVHNNWDDYFKRGFTTQNNFLISEAVDKGNYAIGLGETSQDGIALNTGLQRWNAKVNAQREFGEHWKSGFSVNYSQVEVDKLSIANDGSLAGILAAPQTYNLKDYPYHYPGDPFTQIYYRSLTFDNPYWVAENNTFFERTDRVFGNSYLEYFTNFAESFDLNVRGQIGIDSYTRATETIYGLGTGGGVSSSSVSESQYRFTNTNAIGTANLNWRVTDFQTVTLLLGAEYNDNTSKSVSASGTGLNFGEWQHVNNTATPSRSEGKGWSRTVGFFGQLNYDYNSLVFLGATGRYDIVSTMPSGNRGFFYPSFSGSIVPSELDAVKSINWISFAKVRASYAEVGQAGSYYDPYYNSVGGYSNGWFQANSITMPYNGASAYSPGATLYDENLVPQNTRSVEVGIDLKFFENRFGVDYTYSLQNVKDQIFAVPLASSTGAGSLVTNAGRLSTLVHEVVVYLTPVATGNFQWDMNFNFMTMTNKVEELAEGVESIFLGGFVTPQVRASVGNTYPVIYGSSFARDDNGNILVVDDPSSPYHGMPQTGAPGIIGEVTPDFILGAFNTFTYKNLRLSASLEWKNGGSMYSGDNGLIMYVYGVASQTENREETFVYDGYKPDGTPNDIVRGGPNDPGAYQTLNTNVLGGIDEAYIFDNSFIKLRDVSLRYALPGRFLDKVNIGASVFARNILIWTKLPNLDPESSNGSGNAMGGFNRFSLPQTTSLGFSLDITF